MLPGTTMQQKIRTVESNFQSTRIVKHLVSLEIDEGI